MPRPRKVDPSIRLEIKIPESVYTRLAMHLFSPAQGQVPYGAWSQFFAALAEEALKRLENPNVRS